jgi:hypothetical protein
VLVGSQQESGALHGDYMLCYRCISYIVPHLTKVQKMTVTLENTNDIHARLAAAKSAWENAILVRDKALMTRYCAEYNALSKRVYPVVITCQSRRDFIGNDIVDSAYLNISFAEAQSGWADMDIFHTVQNGRYVLNDLGKRLSIAQLPDGGSACLVSKPEFLDDVVAAIKQHGYLVDVCL